MGIMKPRTRSIFHSCSSSSRSQNLELRPLLFPALTRKRRLFFNCRHVRSPEIDCTVSLGKSISAGASWRLNLRMLYIVDNCVRKAVHKLRDGLHAIQAALTDATPRRRLLTSSLRCQLQPFPARTCSYIWSMEKIGQESNQQARSEGLTVFAVLVSRSDQAG